MRRRSTHYLVHVPTATGDLDQRVDMKNYNVTFSLLFLGLLLVFAVLTSFTVK